MSTAALVRDLRLHLRAWERHGIRFGIVCSRKRLTLCQPLYASACVCAPANELAMLDGAGHGMSLSVVVPDDSLVYRFPYGHRNPRRCGRRNRRFLKGAALPAALHALQMPVQSVIFPLAPIYRTEGVTIGALSGRLQAFFAQLPEEHRYGMEIRNSGYLLPEYFDLLRRHGVVHVLNDADGMPSLLDQVQIPEVMAANPVIVRTTATGAPEWQLGILEIVRRCVNEKKELTVYMADGEMTGAEEAMTGLMELLSQDLARLSPLKRWAA